LGIDLEGGIIMKKEGVTAGEVRNILMKGFSAHGRLINLQHGCDQGEMEECSKIITRAIVKLKPLVRNGTKIPKPFSKNGVQEAIDEWQKDLKALAPRS